MKLLILASVLSLVSLVHGQEITDQERFGKTSEQVSKLGHAKWIAFFCDNSRAGASGRVKAEHIFAIAIHEQNEKKIARLPKQEQEFLSNCRAWFASLAKYAFTVGESVYPSWEGWPLEISKTSTAVNVAIQDLLDRPKLQKVYSKAAIITTLDSRQATILGDARAEDSYSRLHYPSFKVSLNHGEDLFKLRSEKERQIMWRFASEMADVMSTKRL